MNPSDTFGVGKLKPLATGRQQVPAESAISDTTFQNHHRRVQCVAEVVANADLWANGPPFDRHPFVVDQSTAAKTASHDTHVANIFSFSPVAVIVNEVRIKLLLFNRMDQTPFNLSLCRFDLAKAQHVGLPQQHVNLNRFAHIGGLVIRVRKFGNSDRSH